MVVGRCAANKVDVYLGQVVGLTTPHCWFHWFTVEDAVSYSYCGWRVWSTVGQGCVITEERCPWERARRGRVSGPRLFARIVGLYIGAGWIHISIILILLRAFACRSDYNHVGYNLQLLSRFNYESLFSMKACSTMKVSPAMEVSSAWSLFSWRHLVSWTRPTGRHVEPGQLEDLPRFFFYGLGFHSEQRFMNPANRRRWVEEMQFARVLLDRSPYHHHLSHSLPLLEPTRTPITQPDLEQWDTSTNQDTRGMAWPLVVSIVWSW